MERFGYLSLTPSVRAKLLSVSPATVDRLLRDERKRRGKGVGTTKPGSLLKHQIAVRTFADWNDVEPGFLEADSVSHCGESAKGPFLSTLTLTDIYSGWTEMIPLPAKTESAVTAALSSVVGAFPFQIKGLDTDNGSEFINSGVINWCDSGSVTFTRARSYKKNDQAHVEEKNGSIVRRLIGYDRFSGSDSLRKMQKLCEVARLYINYFQPSMKLCTKDREGARVKKKYLPAKTPCERLLESNHLSQARKTELAANFEQLDPVALLKKIEGLQTELWATASVPDPRQIAQESLARILDINNPLAEPLMLNIAKAKRGRSGRKKQESKYAQVQDDNSVIDRIREHINGLPPGRQFKTVDFLHLGPDTAVRKALQRLVNASELLHPGWGTFSTPWGKKKSTEDTKQVAIG